MSFVSQVKALNHLKLICCFGRCTDFLVTRVANGKGYALIPIHCFTYEGINQLKSEAEYNSTRGWAVAGLVKPNLLSIFSRDM